MKIPLKWLAEYVDIDNMSPKDIANSMTAIGLMLDKPIENDVLDLEHRMDRSDWLSVIGCARDFAAYAGTELKYPKTHKQKGKELPSGEQVKIEVECPDLVKRFNTRVFKNIVVRKSPDWLAGSLEAYGIPSINNIVDITNYVMVEFGQPMHAQDLAKMKAREIVIRRAKQNEAVTTLLGETVKLSSDQFVLTQAGEATVIGGIVGGASTGVDMRTTEIVLDAGNYDQTNIRRSSRALKIQNETVLRYDKFLHPALTQLALERATYLILELAGGEYYENKDWYPTEIPVKKMILRYSRVYQVGGMEIPHKRIKEILKALEYKVLSEKSESLEIEVPYFRTDVDVEDDVVSDIYRINDYSKIPLSMISSSPPKEITSEIYKFEDRLRDLMVGLGFHEHITDPLTFVNKEDKSQVVLENALTAEKGALRTDFKGVLAPVKSSYLKHKIEEIKLFEIGKIYKNDRGANVETRVLGMLYENKNLKKYLRAKKVKSFLSSLFSNLGISKYSLKNSDLEEFSNIIIENTSVGRLDKNSFVLDTELVKGFVGRSSNVISEANNYTTENLSLIMDIDYKFGEAYEEIKALSKDIVDVYILEEYTGNDIGNGKKSVLLEILYTTSQTQEIRKKIITILEEKYSILHRE